MLLRLPPGTRADVRTSYLGFDRNDYPGDDQLKPLRQTFSFAGYWLNHPPGANSNSWVGKRKALTTAGFGFLVVFNGRIYAQIKKFGDAKKLGASDATAAATAARREGFPPATIIFLDQEEGGRLLPEQRAYLHAWVDGVSSQNFRAGVYCSGIAAKEDSGESVITAEDIRRNAGGRKIVYWVSNDSCPPSPGCSLAELPTPEASGVPFADVWQYAQSPRRPDFARSCPGYSRGNCYPIDPPIRDLYLDFDTATSSDPSHGRTGN